MKYDGSLFFLAQSNLSDAFDVLSTLKTNISACTSSYPRGYEYKSDIEETKTIIFNVSSTVSSLTRTVSELKEKLMNLDNVFALNYYNDASQKYQDLVGPLTDEQQLYKEYTQKQFNEQLYKYLDDIKDNLTPEQKEIYDALKEQKVIEKKYNELQKLYEKKDDNNAFWHPIKEEDLRQEILALENELREKHNVNINGYRNTWYEDFKDAGTKTGAAWVDAGKSLLKGEGLGKTLDAVKQTAATGAVVYKSAKSGVDKIDELVGDGLLAAGGSIVAGATWLFHDTWSDNDVAGNVMDWTLDQVRRDRVGEANKEFYEKNPIGKWINKNSNLKYDSAGAKAIQKTSKLATEIIIATAAEIGSFGAATPLVTAMFVAEGAGEAAESYAQSVDRNNGESYNYGMALGSTALGGISGAMKSKMYGKIGGNTLNILKNPSLIKTGVALLKETGAKKILTNELKSTSFWFDVATTGIQKGGEVVNEYHQTGNINWGKVLTSFAGELLYARLTDKLTANSIDEIINQKTVFQTMKDVSSTAKNFSKKVKFLANDFVGKNNNFSVEVDSSVSSFIKKSSTDGYFGVSQESTSRYKKFTIEDVDWLSKNSTDLELYLKSKYNLQNAAEYIENWKKTREINDFTKEVLEKFIYESNPNNFEDNISLINNLFGVKELPEYVRQKNILMKKGLSEMDSIKLLDSMDNAKFGIANCTYASTANAIFSQFDGKEHEFKKIFGFDMYIEIDGVKRLNGNELILDMYTHMNSSLNKNKYHPGNLLSVNSDGNMKLNDINATRVRANSSSILSEYFNSKGLKNVKLDECTFDLRKLTIDRNNFEKELNINFDGSKSYKLDLRCCKNSDFDFINTKPIDYYDSSGNLLLHMDNSGHSVFITGISDKGVECSSWGKKCYIPFSCFSGNKGVTIMSVNLEV